MKLKWNRRLLNDKSNLLGLDNDVIVIVINYSEFGVIVIDCKVGKCNVIVSSSCVNTCSELKMG